MITKKKLDQLYKVEWYIEENGIEGYGIGTYSLFKNLDDGMIYFDFKIDGEKTIYRFELKHILSIQEYNYDRRSNL